MKFKLILSITLLLLTTLLTAQLLSENTNTEVNTKYKNHFNLIIGGDLGLTYLTFWHDIKIGIGYETRNLSLSALFEYIGTSQYETSIIHPHIKLGCKLTEKLEIFAFSGIGFGTFEASDDDWTLKKDETLSGYGFGAEFYWFTISYHKFNPASVVLGSITDEYSDRNFRYEAESYNSILTLGFVINMNLSHLR